MATDIGRAWKVKTLLATALLGTSAAASAGCNAIPALTISALQNTYVGQLFLLENEGQAMGTLNLQQVPPYLQLNSVTDQGAISGIFLTGGQQQTYTISGTVTQVGTDGLSITFSYNTSPTTTEGGGYTYTGALQLSSNCDLYMAGTYTELVVMHSAKFGYLFENIGPFPFSGFARL